MNIFQIILIGLMLTAVGCVVQIITAPVFAISYRTVFKRSIIVIVCAELVTAAVFCLLNGVNPSAHGIFGMLGWHGTRVAVICLECVFNYRLHNIASDRTSKRKPMAILHVVISAVVAQFLQYQIINAIY